MHQIISPSSFRIYKNTYPKRQSSTIQAARKVILSLFQVPLLLLDTPKMKWSKAADNWAYVPTLLRSTDKITNTIYRLRAQIFFMFTDPIKGEHTVY